MQICVPYSHLGLLEHKPHCFPKLGVLGAPVWCRSQGSGNGLGHKPCLLRETLLFLQLPPEGLRLESWARPHPCLSHPSRCGPFILCCGGAVQLVFRVLLEGIFLHMAVYSGYPWEEVSSESSYAANLDCAPKLYVPLKIISQVSSHWVGNIRKMG